MLTSLIDWVVSLVETLGGPGVGLAILLENLFPPIPSEVVLPLAGFAASRGDLDAWSAFLWATAGSVLGAYLLYWLGATVGAQRLRGIADRMWLVEAGDVDRSLRWFDRYGGWSVFFGRLIPGIRSLISVPAGVDRMNPLLFGLLTLTGSALWNGVLIAAGVWLGARHHLVEEYVDRYSLAIYVIVGCAVLLALAGLVRRSWRRRRAPAGSPGPEAGTPDTTR